MSDKHQHDWSNYWQGRTASASGKNDEALVGVGIEHNAQLAEFWTHQFASLDKSAQILDMACGAGSVLRHAHANGFTDLSGVDISADAIASMCAEFPKAVGVVAPVDATGFDTGAFDMVVSQYGFEYAGSERQVLAATHEMARLLNSKGQFTALCHIKDGGIEQEVTEHLHDIKYLAKTKFITRAKAVFIAADAAEKEPNLATKTAYDKAVMALSEPKEKITTWLTSASQGGGSEIHGLGRHLYQGTVEMFNRRRAFALSDITGWLDGIQYEIDAYHGRMRSMKSAAVNVKTAHNILTVFKEQGFKVSDPETFYLDGDVKPAAWILRATRDGSVAT